MLPVRRWYPFEGLPTLHRDLDRLFDRLFTGRDWWPWPEISDRFVPALEAYAEDGEFHVRAELPGIDPKEVDVSVVDNRLIIKGERKTSQEKKEAGYYLSEIAHGRFERTVVLPEGADTEKINARYDKGVLEITVPLKEAVAPKKVAIEVKAGEEK